VAPAEFKNGLIENESPKAQQIPRLVRAEKGKQV